MHFNNGVAASEIADAVWVKSSDSIGDGNCVELAGLWNGMVAMRNSRFPEGPALVFTADELSAFLAGAKRAEFDTLIH